MADRIRRSDGPTGQKDTEVRHARRHANFLFSASPLPMWVYDAETLRFLEVSKSAEEQYGFTREEFFAMTLPEICGSTTGASRAYSEASATPQERIDIHFKKDGTQINVKVREKDVRFRGKGGRLMVAENVTGWEHLHGNQGQQALHDDLTGLPNRILLEQRMPHVFAAAKEREHRAAILCLDVDRFEEVNTFYGRAVGDECLKRVGTLLTRRLRGMDTVARTGGGEFTILLGEVESVAAAGIVAKALMELFATPVKVEQHMILLRASVGVAVYPDHGERSNRLWRNAEAAMHNAKLDGGGRYLLVQPDTNAEVNESEMIDLHMRAMMLSGGFRLHYQPQYDTSGQIRGMEALLRLPHPTLGFISPERFIPLAEESGMIHALGKWVIEEACKQLALWNKPGMIPVRVAVNVSPLQLMRSDFAPEVRQTIVNSGMDPTLLEMEITERVVLNFDEIAKRMTELAALGVRFAVDDFGTGYSSLQHLHRLPISTLKIDRSFVQRLCESSRSYPIVKAIIAMAHSLKMQVIAEGVEDEDQMEVLRELKCDFIQGFLLSRPLPPEEIVVLLRRPQLSA